MFYCVDTLITIDWVNLVLVEENKKNHTYNRYFIKYNIHGTALRYIQLMGNVLLSPFI